MIASFDIDGVIFMGDDLPGIYPGPEDIIITGRSIQEMPETIDMLRRRGINQIPFFNPIPFDQKSRETSGIHKGQMLKLLINSGFDIRIHYEDDPVQIEQIKWICPEVNVVYIQHDLVTKENVRHL